MASVFCETGKDWQKRANMMASIMLLKKINSDMRFIGLSCPLLCYWSLSVLFFVAEQLNGSNGWLWCSRYLIHLNLRWTLMWTLIDGTNIRRPCICDVPLRFDLEGLDTFRFWMEKLEEKSVLGTQDYKRRWNIVLRFLRLLHSAKDNPGFQIRQRTLLMASYRDVLCSWGLYAPSTLDSRSLY